MQRHSMSALPIKRTWFRWTLCFALLVTAPSLAEAETVGDRLHGAVVGFQRCLVLEVGERDFPVDALRVSVTFPPAGGQLEIDEIGVRTGSLVYRCAQGALARVHSPQGATQAIEADCLLPLPGARRNAIRCVPRGSSLPQPEVRARPTPPPAPAAPAPTAPPPVAQAPASPLCAAIACSGHGTCVVVRGEPACACEAGFAPDDNGINCVATTPAAATSSTTAPRPAAPPPAPLTSTWTAPQPEANAPSASPPLPRSPSMSTIPATASVQGQRQLHVTTDRGGARAALDRQRLRGVERLVAANPWRTTPFTFPASTGMHSLEITQPRFQDVSIPVPAGSEDLLINVEMGHSRARLVFGAIFTGLGSAIALGGLGTMLAGTNDDSPDDLAMVGGIITAFSAVLLGPGIPLIVSGRRQRPTTFTIVEADTRASSGQ